MTWENTLHAGGAIKNRKADVRLRLPAGHYRLRFRSDDSHAFMDWNAAAPDHIFWGVVVRDVGA